MTGKNPTIAALLGLALGPIAYLYVWRVRRGILVLILNFLLFTVLFGEVDEYTPAILATSLAVSILVSFDCWRIVKYGGKTRSADKTVSVEAAAGLETAVKPAEKPEVTAGEVSCSKCGFGLALPYKACPMCGAET